MTCECVNCLLATYVSEKICSFASIREFAMHFMLLCVVVVVNVAVLFFYIISFHLFFFSFTLSPFLLDCCPHWLHAGNGAILDRNDFALTSYSEKLQCIHLFCRGKWMAGGNARKNAISFAQCFFVVALSPVLFLSFHTYTVISSQQLTLEK